MQRVSGGTVCAAGSRLLRRRGLAVAVVSLFASCGPLAASAFGGVANAGIPGAPSNNPLAGLPWGIYTGPIDGVWPAYAAARGTQRRLLARIALRPSVYWFGPWNPDNAARGVARGFIDNVTRGKDSVLSQIAVFRVDPWENAACTALPSAAAQASYKQWIDGFAAGIGESRVALILQPDLPFALCVPQHSVLPLRLVAYAAKVFNALPHTTVYIDVGAADWVNVRQATWLLRQAGVRYARGFALNDTHYDSTGNELAFGARVSQALAAAHIRGRHFVINTAENGAPFLYYKYHGNIKNPPPCASRFAHSCPTLGIPPTWRVSDRRWHLSRRARAIARRLADAYLWAGRPWLDYGAGPFDLNFALGLARSTPF
ncbi:MAG: glycoside hydrolase family 6 protein [Actinomycetota bacterium]|nr:glycoside hydrolase family 6 protein [Actinomycetota bacterium]